MKEQHNKKKNKALDYFEDSLQELKKVTWPTKNQAVRLTLLVLGFCFAAAIIIGAMDAIFNFGHQQLVNYASSVVPPAVESNVDATAGSELPVTKEAAPVSGEAPLKVTATTTPATQQ